MAEGWSADLLDSQDRALCSLRRVTGGSLDWSIFRTVQGQGSLDIVEGGTTVEPNWLSDRVKLWHTGRDGVRRPMGVWLVTRPSRRHEGAHITRSTLQLADKTQLLNQPVGAWLTYPAGTVVTSTVLGIIYSRGESRANITASAETLRAAASFEPSDTWLHVAGTLLRAIGHADLYADMDGVLTSAPYVDAADRPLSATYGPGQSKMLPTWDDEADVSKIPNKVHVIASGTQDEAGLIGVARNDNPDDPLSTVNRPEVVHQEDADEATSQTAIDNIAAKRLAELQSVVRRTTYTHPVDGTRLNDRVQHDPAGYSGAVVQRAVRIVIGANVTDTARRIYTGGDLPW